MSAPVPGEVYEMRRGQLYPGRRLRVTEVTAQRVVGVCVAHPLKPGGVGRRVRVSRLTLREKWRLVEPAPSHRWPPGMGRVSPGRPRIDTYPDRAITGRRPVGEPQRPSTDQALLWGCLVPEHQEVWWDGNTARCAHFGCGLTSEHTEGYAALVRAAERRRVAIATEVARREAAASAYRSAAAMARRSADQIQGSGSQWTPGAALLRRATEVERGEP